MKAGDRVRHEQHGEGQVLSLRSGYRARVRFDLLAGLPRTVRRHELKLQAVAAPVNGCGSRVEAVSFDAARLSLPTSPKRRPRLRPALALEERGSARQAIEALRLGIVPAEFARDYTIARDEELASMEALLATGRGLRIVWGDYGQGKTHLLEILERLALEAGFLTARIVLDPAEVPPTHPKRLYRAIVSALASPEGARGLAPILHRLIDSEAHRSPDGDRASRFLSPALFALHRGDEELMAAALDYASGESVDGASLRRSLARLGWTGPRLLTLSDYRTYCRLYLHLLGTIAAWAKDAGYCGLLLLLDEVEAVGGLRRRRLRYARQSLMHFAAATLPEEQLGFEAEPSLYRGGHEVHRHIPLQFRPDQPLSVVFAMTPLPAMRRICLELVCGDDLEVTLRPPTRWDLEDLIRRLYQLYRHAYPESSARGLPWIQRELRAAFDEDHADLREIVRSTVLSLDHFRLAKPRPVEERVAIR